ncbi:hypothetical protein LguiB_028200 [Lonicera macranthoides]
MTWHVFNDVAYNSDNDVARFLMLIVDDSTILDIWKDVHISGGIEIYSEHDFETNIEGGFGDDEKQGNAVEELVEVRKKYAMNKSENEVDYDQEVNAQQNNGNVQQNSKSSDEEESNETDAKKRRVHKPKEGTSTTCKGKDKASTATKGKEKVDASSGSNVSKGKEKVDVSSNDKGKPIVKEKMPKGFGEYISPNTGDSYVKVILYNCLL